MHFDGIRWLEILRQPEQHEATQVLYVTKFGIIYQIKEE